MPGKSILLLVFLRDMLLFKCEPLLNNLRCCNLTCLETTVNILLEVRQEAGLMRRPPTAYGTFKIFISYEFSQLSRILGSGWQDMFSMDHITCVWTLSTGWEDNPYNSRIEHVTQLTRLYMDILRGTWSSRAHPLASDCIWNTREFLSYEFTQIIWPLFSGGWQDSFSLDHTSWVFFWYRGCEWYLVQRPNSAEDMLDMDILVRVRSLYTCSSFTRWKPTAYKTRKECVSCGFTQVSILSWWGGGDAFSNCRSVCFMLVRMFLHVYPDT